MLFAGLAYARNARISVLFTNRWNLIIMLTVML